MLQNNLPSECAGGQRQKLLLVVSLLFLSASVATAQTTQFSYQGSLRNSGNPANGSHDFQFGLFDTATVGTGVQLGPTLTRVNVVVSSGFFNVQLDFGACASCFDGQDRFLYIQNNSSPQASSNFNISGNGVIGGTLGIGTNTPAGLFHVKGTSPVRILGDTSTLSGSEYVDFFARTSIFSSDLGGMRIQRQSNGNIDTLVFAAPNGSPASEKLRIGGNGNVGIGISSPEFRLDVGDRMRVRSGPSGSAGIWFNQFFNFASWDQAFVGMQDDTHVGLYGNNGAGWSLIADTTTGNVGIGTTNPDRKLTLQHGGGAYLNLKDTFGPSEVLLGVDGNGGILSTMTNHDLQLRAGGNDTKMVIKGNGTVGIGILNPNSFYRLVVDGGNRQGILGFTSSGALFEAGLVGLSTNGSLGVYGSSTGFGAGVYGYNGAGYAVYGEGPSAVNGRVCCGGSWAGYFTGNVNVTGSLSKGGGSFKIDHPLDPENKYLYHSFVESPDMKNIYDGVALLDASGEAVVELTNWFMALNKDFRYQLTAIGAPAPNLYVSEELINNRFKIAGGQPVMKVSWQVTATRQDAYANAHRIPVEEDKPSKERGYYLYPDLVGQPEEKGIEWAHNPEMMRQMKERRHNLPSRKPDR